jgi:AraC-like DNA-binding protein
MLTELLDTFQLRAEVYNNAQFCGNWQVNAHKIGQTCFHMVTIGQCLMRVENHPTSLLEMGDLVIFPRELAHTLEPIDSEREDDVPMTMIGANQNVSGTAILCGELLFEHAGFNHILDALPEIMIIKANQAPWISPLLEQIRNEMLDRESGNNTIINRLSELLFIYALRHHIKHGKNLCFLNLFIHPELQPAINSIKNNPEKNWTLETLAQACAMSRTKFSQLFKKVSGKTVNEYLTWWRMQLAYKYLMKGIRISQVADNVGYQSEAAFSRVFKKHYGISPGKINLN